MSRIRTLKPGFFRSRSLAKVTRDARLTFQGLWVEADDAGRGIAHADLLKGTIWPLDADITADVIDAHLLELAAAHIVLYEVDGERYYEILNWEKHQAAAYRKSPPQHPEPPAQTTIREPARVDTILHDPPHEIVLEGNMEVEGKGRDIVLAKARSAGFEMFYERFPRHVARAAAGRAYTAALKRADPDTIAAGLERMLPELVDANGRGYCPHPATWLNRDQWNDQPSAPVHPSTRSDVRSSARRRLDEIAGRTAS